MVPFSSRMINRYEPHDTISFKELEYRMALPLSPWYNKRHPSGRQRQRLCIRTESRRATKGEGDVD